MRTLLGATLACATLACSGPLTSASPTATSPAARLPDARSTGGCGQTPINRGPAPSWVDQAAAHNLPDLPYVMAIPDVAAGFLFAYPLRAVHPPDRSNKVLWVVRTPRQGSALQIDGHPLGAQQPTVHVSRPADSGPGEIYPDGVDDVPEPGCWHFTLQWATGRAAVDLKYVPK
jgi:hypothetical protein